MADIFATIGCFLLSILISTIAVRRGIPILQARQPRVGSRAGDVANTDRSLPESGMKNKLFDWTSNGLWIGLCETTLIFVFIFERQYGALAIIMAAKEFVRREKIERNPAYYLLGTLLNLSTAILFALLARYLTGRLE